ncbi:radical SAM protein [Eubacterium sp. 1001713B170207_170306_E7]|uniref:radical SAM/SPASM domain-containing protein n=1 Tax=Eubacterium sp. 1001713B170207_170306_E7 TaxID=2787097 RepID=UPI00189B80BD|nr:radical SAM protein [Eubacterium sp. 1001713B170207_170306_E7]
MKQNKDLTRYMNNAIEKLAAGIVRGTLRNPRETAFILKLRDRLAQAMKKREAAELRGRHIPPFLISSIATECNLHCKGCYARANGICGSGEDRSLTAAEWQNIFKEAAALGVSFNLLAGGEPLTRRDVLEAAAQVRELVFPVFTNGLLIDEATADFFAGNRHLIPVISIEGDRAQTDGRRGEGTHRAVQAVMERLRKRGILFGVSITVTRENLHTVTGDAFISNLDRQGCRIAFFVEYVPVEESSASLAPSEAERMVLEQRQTALRETWPGIIFLSFPGDEKHMGGCLAAGRGFFHINAYGAAEACPFSPYSDRSLKQHTLLEVLDSPFFASLQQEALVGGEHDGGCALFQKQSQVQALLKQT